MELAEGEQILWEGGPAWPVVSFDRLVFGLILFLLSAWFSSGGTKGETVSAFVTLIAMGYLVYVLLTAETGRYAVTNWRAVVEVSSHNLRTSEIKLTDVRNIRIRRSLLDRLFGTSTLELSSAGSLVAEVAFNRLFHAESVKELIQKQAGGKASVDSRRGPRWTRVFRSDRGINYPDYR